MRFAFLVYSSYLVKPVSVLRKENYGCFAEKYWSSPFGFIMNSVMPSKIEMIWVSITVFFCWKNITTSFSSVYSGACFLAEFETHLLFLLMIFIYICIWYEFKRTVWAVVLLCKYLKAQVWNTSMWYLS